ncbi:hypothetical protein [Actinoplanes sp. NPDC051494]|uniref:hypothetical protein n=1 Tax=Actinoplanes sp. NPDC051494 TaxID=3363907 RepID=UPI0037960302
MRPAGPRPPAPRPWVAGLRMAGLRMAGTVWLRMVCLAVCLGMPAGCGDPDPRPPAAAGSPSAVLPSPSASSAATYPAETSPAATSAATTPVPEPAVTVSRGWEVTVYYTAVEKFHDGAETTVTGCPTISCANGDDDLGAYPEDFVAAVEEEGTGRTADGTYLNWSYDTGYWLDTAPRDTAGHALRAFASAAADPGVLVRGTRFRITGCGTADDGSRPAAEVCAALRDARWEVTDEFTPGLGGSRHIDAYIGEETGPGFTDSAWYLTLRNATLGVG